MFFYCVNVLVCWCVDVLVLFDMVSGDLLIVQPLTSAKEKAHA